MSLDFQVTGINVWSRLTAAAAKAQAVKMNSQYAKRDSNGNILDSEIDFTVNLLINEDRMKAVIAKLTDEILPEWYTLQKDGKLTGFASNVKKSHLDDFAEQLADVVKGKFAGTKLNKLKIGISHLETLIAAKVADKNDASYVPAEQKLLDTWPTLPYLMSLKSKDITKLPKLSAWITKNTQFKDANNPDPTYIQPVRDLPGVYPLKEVNVTEKDDDLPWGDVVAASARYGLSLPAGSFRTTLYFNELMWVAKGATPYPSAGGGFSASTFDPNSLDGLVLDGGFDDE